MVASGAEYKFQLDADYILFRDDKNFVREILELSF